MGEPSICQPQDAMFNPRKTMTILQAGQIDFSCRHVQPSETSLARAGASDHYWPHQLYWAQGFYYREVMRFVKIITQTVFAPILTAALFWLFLRLRSVNVSAPKGGWITSSFWRRG